jgi:hypothetical protein
VSTARSPIAALTASLLLAGGLLASGEAAADGVTRVDLPGSRDGGIAIGGVIGMEDVAAFHKLAEQAPNAVVVISGPGGRVAAAIQIGEELRLRGMQTMVPANTDCASACALIWLAGAKRTLMPGGRIGFHAVSMLRQNGARTETHDIDYVLRNYLSWLGYSADATATIVNTPSDFVRWLDPIELQANGFATATGP